MSGPFDETRYRGLLEGLEATEVSKSHLLASAVTERFDAEFFQKGYLHDEALIENRPEHFKTFHDLGLTVDASAFYPSIEPYYDSGDFPFLRVADVNSVINLERCTTIPEELCRRFNTLKTVSPGDIVLTKGGSVARVGLVTRRAAASRDLIFVNSSRLAECDYVFLYLYFQTAFCNRLLVRSSSQSVQAHLTLTLVKDIPLFWPSQELRNAVLHLVKESYATRDKAIRSYQQAETTLLAELGLLGWQPPEALSYERKASEAFTAGRLDAEHFQPKYNALFSLLAAKGDVRLGDCVIEPIRRGISPDYVEDGGDLRVINSKHVGKTHVELEDNRFVLRESLFSEQSDNAGQVPKGMVRQGDVLLNSTGMITIGRCQCLLDEVSAVVDNHVAIIRPIAELDPVYLACFLNSLPGQMQTERGWTGSSGQIELRPDLVADYRIWKAPMAIQRRVRDCIEKSHAARGEAKTLLDRAKRAVEIAIETGESAALEYLHAFPPPMSRSREQATMPEIRRLNHHPDVFD